MQKEMRESLDTIYRYVERMKALILQQKDYIEELEKKQEIKR